MPRSHTTVLPGRNSVGLVAVLVAMWYAGVAQGNGAAHLLCFFLASIAAVSAIHAWANLRGVRVRCGNIAPVFAGERLLVPLTVEVGTGATAAALRVDAGDVKHAVTFDEVLPGAGARAVLSVAADRRGCYETLRVTVTSRYPLGFFTARRRFVVEQKFHVYPRAEGSAPMPEREAAERERREGSRVEGDDFAGVRPWLRGESQRHIDWKAAARGQPLLSKQWAGDGGETLHFDLRDTPSGDVEARLSQLARWVVMAERSGSRYGLTLPDAAIAPDRGDAHFHACLRALAAFSPEADAP